MQSTLKRIAIVCLSMMLLLFTGFTKSFASPLTISGEHYTMRNGLPSNTVRCITQDLQGKLWFGTANGIATFDGYSIRNVTGLPSGDDKNVQGISADAFGNVWIISSSGKITCFEAREEKPKEEINHEIQKGKYSHVDFYPDNIVCLWGKEDGIMLVGMAKSNPEFKRIAVTGTENDSRNSLPEKCLINFAVRNGENIWIGTNQGLYAYAIKEEQLKTVNGGCCFISAAEYRNDQLVYASDGNIYKVDTTLRVKNPGRLINPVKETDYKGNVVYKGRWYIYGRDGVCCFDLNTNKETSASEELKIDSPRISHDNERDAWIIGKDDVLTHISCTTDSISVYDFMKNSEGDVSDNNAHSSRLRYYNAKDMIWIASNGGGLYAYDKKNRENFHWGRHSSGIYEQPPIVSDRLLTVYQDRSGSLWIGYEQDGLSHVHVSDNRWVNYIFPDNTQDTYGDYGSFRMVSNIDGNRLYVSNRSNTLYCLDRNLSLIDKTNYPQDVYAVETDTTGTLWVGMKYGGLIIGNKAYRHSRQDASTLGDNNVFDIHRDRNGRMWIATFGGGLDLAVRDENGNIVFEHYLDGNRKGRQIRTIAEDKNGRLWIGSSGGVSVVDPDVIISNPKSYMTLSVENGLLDSNEIRNIWCSESGDIYIAQTGMGFARIELPEGEDYSKIIISRLNMANGLCSDMVKSFTEDDDGNIWIATDYGLSRFDCKNCLFDSYYPSLNMEGNVFNESAATKYADGRLVFGSGRGLCVVQPDELIKKQDTTEIKDVIIKTEGRRISAQFYTYDFASHTPVKYSYKIVESGEGWSTPSTMNSVEIHNQSYGMHTLAVKAVGDNGIWSKVYTVEFEIPTPWYLSWWAIISYLLLAACAFQFIFRIISDRLKLNEQMSLAKDLTEAQMSFFKKISESFRTPLTLIKGNIEKLIVSGEQPSSSKAELSQMDYYAEQLLATMQNLTLIKTEFQKGHFVLKEELPIMQTENSIALEDAQTEIPETEIPLNEQKVLIAEPDEKIRTHLRKSLGRYFNVIATESGTTAIEILKKQEINIVISAAVMPEVSGVDLLKSIRKDSHTNHIPVILLTAYDTTENIVAGTEAGADAYLRKPFSTRILLANIINLLNQRARLRNRYSNDLALSEPKVFDNRQDREFLEKFDKLIDLHLSEGDFSVDELASQLGVGRTVFYKRIKQLTNYTPNDYIRYRRMKHAAKLLAEGSHTVSEVSYMVGISDPLYFSRTFKKYFGVAPSIYLKNLKSRVAGDTSR